MTTPAPPAARAPDTGAAVATAGLDAASLRAIFPAAPADAAVPSGVGELTRRRMARIGGDHAGSLRIGLVIAVLVGAVLVVLGQAVAGGALVGVVAVATLGTWALQHSRASDDFFAAYADARGLDHQEEGDVPECVALLRAGDRRRCPRVLRGPIAGEDDAVLALFTSTEITTDSDGDRQEHDTHHTIVMFTLPAPVAARFAGVSCSPRSLSLGKLQDALAGDRGVELESSAFTRRYSLRCDDGQDDIALYELFSPTFIDVLASTTEVHWQQVGGDLVCHRSGHLTEAAELDAFCADAARVLDRYLQEHR